jgi:hypothetical protein
MEAKRVIVIGCRDAHDRETLKRIADWALVNGYAQLFKAISADKLDVYDMTTKLGKGDGVDALKKRLDTVAVITLHLFGLDGPQSEGYADLNGAAVYGGGRGYGKHKKDLWMYTKSNHEIIGICLERGIPLVCFGDQPFRKSEKLPLGVKRTCVAKTATYRFPVYIYEKKEEQ